MQRGSNPVSPHKDDEMKHALQGYLRSGQHTHTQDALDPEPVADDDVRVHPGGPVPPPGEERERAQARADAEALRFELARHLDRKSYPADRQSLTRTLAERHAPDEVLDAVRDLPSEGSYRNPEEIVRAVVSCPRLSPAVPGGRARRMPSGRHRGGRHRGESGGQSVVQRGVQRDDLVEADQLDDAERGLAGLAQPDPSPCRLRGVVGPEKGVDAAVDAAGVQERRALQIDDDARPGGVGGSVSASSRAGAVVASSSPAAVTTVIPRGCGYGRSVRERPACAFHPSSAAAFRPPVERTVPTRRGPDTCERTGARVSFAGRLTDPAPGTFR
ncbi:DUF2795 domain-containing protein [Streptomyces sp. GC420]|nr:DUF2795 domain-containing protein [Streptomyces sp. GC420]NBM19281.1 DUF2795 domain-containing protein [Streptomyces sp. GC420]